MFVASVTQHATRMRHIVICGLSGSIILFHIIPSTARFSGKKIFRFSLQICRKHFSFYDELGEIWTKMYTHFQVMNELFLSHFNETWILWRIFEKYSNIKFHGNPSNWGRAVPCGRTERRTADITKPILAFRNSASAPKNEELVTVIMGTVTQDRAYWGKAVNRIK